MSEAKQMNGAQTETEHEEAPEATPEHESDCWRNSRCWCFVDEDQFAEEMGRGER